jgi:hypothetical protein
LRLIVRRRSEHLSISYRCTLSETLHLLGLWLTFGEGGSVRC